MAEAKVIEKTEKTEEITEASVTEKAKLGEELTPEETAVLNKTKAPEKEEIGDEEETAETAEAEETEEPEPKKKVEAPPTDEIPEDRKKVILDEVNKPEAAVDLSKLNMTQTELGLYWDLRKARRKNQKLEEELEVERVEKIVTNLKTKEKPPAEEIVEEDPLKDKDDEDILTVGEMRKLLSKKTEAKPEVKKGLLSAGQIRIEKIEADQRLKTHGINDFYDVVDFAETALKDDPDAIDILRETAKVGGNTAEKTYWLIKGSSAWPKIEKMIKDEKEKIAPKTEAKKPILKENTERAKRIEENDGKIKTTGAATGAVADTGEYSVEEIKDMTIDDIKKLPKSTRQQILKKYGSAPNFSV